jgi:hypothetical protein
VYIRQLQKTCMTLPLTTPVYLPSHGSQEHLPASTLSPSPRQSTGINKGRGGHDAVQSDGKKAPAKAYQSSFSPSSSPSRQAPVRQAQITCPLLYAFPRHAHREPCARCRASLVYSNDGGDDISRTTNGPSSQPSKLNPTRVILHNELHQNASGTCLRPKDR